MSTIRFFLILIAVFFLSLGSTNAADKRERLAVLDLEPKFGIEGSFAEALSMVMRDEIHSHGQYSVMSREDLRAVASREQLMQAMGCDEGGNCLVDFGRAIGTRFMVVGAISKIGGVYIVNLRMLDTKGATAGLVHRVSKRCKCDDEALIGTIQSVAAEIIGQTSSADKAAAQKISSNQKQIESDKKKIAELEAERQKVERENQRLVKSLQTFEQESKTATATTGIAKTYRAKQTGSQFVTIGTGGVTGVYYPTGGAICRLVNKSSERHGVRCTVESTGGSVFNLNSIASGKFDMGIAQSDWQYHAYEGSNKFSNVGPNKDLRSLFSVHPEPFTVVARSDSGIKNFSDLKGKRVNIGNPGSGQRGMMEQIMKKLGWRLNDFRLTSELRAAEQMRALCADKVDAIVYTVGHPNGSIAQATNSCNARLVNVSGKKIDTLVEERPYYRKTTIPGGMYRGAESDTETIGVGATLVSSSKVADNVIYQVVKAVFENFEDFKKLHPAFKYLKKKEMVRDSLSAPLHSGAKKYYREAGLL